MCMGMVRALKNQLYHLNSIPHVHGDGSPCSQTTERCGWYSPCAWGWIAAAKSARFNRNVFPMCMGMDLGIILDESASHRIPHVHGDGSGYWTNGVFPHMHGVNFGSSWIQLGPVGPAIW